MNKNAKIDINTLIRNEVSILNILLNLILTKKYSMKAILTLTFTLLTLFSALYSQESPTSQQGMTNQIMERILKGKVEVLEGSDGNWQMLYQDRLVFILTDQSNNRMRIFTPFLEIDSLETGEMDKLLAANFHSALDAKYCFFEGLVMSVYTHPLRELTQPQFEDALLQVVTLADNFGDSYSSTDLLFSPSKQETESPSEKELEKEKRLNKKPGKGKS